MRIDALTRLSQLTAALLVVLFSLPARALDFPQIGDWQDACGPVCVKVAARLYGRDIPVADLRQAMRLGEDGKTSLLDITRTLRAHGFHARGLIISGAEIEKMRIPCITHDPPKHFVVLVGLGEGNGLLVIDAPKRPWVISPKQLAAHGPLHAVAVSTAPLTAPARSPGVPRGAGWAGAALLVISLSGLACIGWGAWKKAAPAARRRAVLLLSGCLAGTVAVGAVWSHSRWLSAAKAFMGAGATPARFEEMVWDFGTLEKGEKRRHTFAFKNRGHDVLTISHVRADCGCLKAKASADLLPPGGDAEIVVDLDLTEMEGFVRKSVYVSTLRGESEPQISLLRVKGFVRGDEDILAFPEVCSFGDVVRGKAVSRRVILRRNMWAPFEVMRVGCDSPLLNAVAAREPSPHGDICSLVITLQAESALCDFTGSVAVHTNDPDYPEKRIPASAVIVDDIYVSPPVCLLARAKDSGNVSVDCFVGSRTGTPIEVELTGSGPMSDISVTAQPANSERALWRLSVDGHARQDTGILRQELAFSVSRNGEKSVLSIPAIMFGSPFPTK